MALVLLLADGTEIDFYNADIEDLQHIYKLIGG